MKQWKKTLCIAAAMLVICAAIVFLSGNRKECCLCKSPNYSVPCLVDLETGDILELNLDGPSATYDGNGQADVETFSFIRFRNVTGTKQTAPNVITLKIPTEDKSRAPALCRNCRQLLPQGYDGRYALADIVGCLLFPVTADSEISVCRYTVQVTQKASLLSVLIIDPAKKCDESFENTILTTFGSYDFYKNMQLNMQKVS